MTQQEVTQFSALRRQAEREALAIQERFQTEFKDVCPFLSGETYEIDDITNEDISYAFFWGDSDEYVELPINVLSEKGLLEYVSQLRQEQARKKKRDAELLELRKKIEEEKKNTKEYQDYLRLKLKYSSLDKDN